MTHTLRLFAAGMLTVLAPVLAAQPLQLQTQPPLNPPAPEVVLLSHNYTVPDANVRILSLADAATLLNSTEGPAWRVFQVHAPVCEKQKGIKDKKKRKEAQTNCKQAAADCKQATKFAKKYRAQISCSALYIHQAVLLTTSVTEQDGNPQHK